MGKARSHKKNKSDFSFTDTHIQFFERGTAEFERDHLEDIYLDNEFIREALSFSSTRTFFIGRTGVGKSAIIENIKSKSDPEFVIQLDPDSFVPGLLQGGRFLEQLQANGISVEYFLKTLWRILIVAELLKRRRKNDKRNIIEKILQKNDSFSRAQKFLDRHDLSRPDQAFGEKLLGFVSDLRLQIEGLGIKFEVSGSRLDPAQHQRIVDTIKKFEFAEINKVINDLDDILEGDNYYILIDDLDKSIVDGGLGTELIKSLFLALIDIANLKHVKAVVSLRTNLFSQIKFSQPEKLRAFICQMSWDDNELKKMLDRRFQFLFKLDTNYVWSTLFPSEIHFSQGQIPIHKYLMRMSNRRPRDLFLLIASAMKYAKGKSRLTQDAFRKCESEFSEDRLSNLVAEWESPLQGLGELLSNFQGCEPVMTGSDLRRVIDNIIVQADSDSKFGWLYSGGYIGRDEKTFDNPNGIFSLLFKIGVIGFKDNSNQIRFCFDYQTPTNDFRLSDDITVFVNPAIARALTKTDAIYRQSPDIEVRKD